MSDSQRSVIKQVATLSYLWDHRLAQARWGKGIRRRLPKSVSCATAGFTCSREETILKYEKYLWEDGVIHKETLSSCCASDFESVLYLIKCRGGKKYLQTYNSPDVYYMPILEWDNSCPRLTNYIDWTSSQ